VDHAATSGRQGLSPIRPRPGGGFAVPTAAARAGRCSSAPA